MKKLQQNLNHKGMALLTVVLVFFILCILLAGVMTFATTNQDNAQTGNKHTTVYYSAESGINTMTEKLNEFMADPNNLLTPSVFTTALGNFKTSNNGLTLASSSLGSTISTIVTFLDLPDVTIGSITYSVIRIVSVSTLDGVTRTLYSDYLYDFTTTKALGAVVTKSKLDLDQLEKITGPIGSNNGPITVDQAKDCDYLTTINYFNGSVPTDCSFVTKVKMPVIVDFPPIVAPTLTGYTYKTVSNVNTSNVTVDLSNPGTYNAFKMTNFSPSSTKDLTINLGTWATSETFVDLWVTGSFSLPKKIILTGTGKLRIRTSKTINISNFALEPAIDPLRLFIVSDGTITFGSSCSFMGSIVSLSTANIELNTCSYNGYLITNTNNITFKKGGMMNVVPIVIYAPNANVSFTVQSSIRGSIIANTFYVKNGNTNIIYDGSLYNPQLDDLFWFKIPTIYGENIVLTNLQPIFEQ